MNRTFQVSERPCATGRFKELDHIRTPNGRFECRYDHIKRFGRCHAEPFDLNLSAIPAAASWIDSPEWGVDPGQARFVGFSRGAPLMPPGYSTLLAVVQQLTSLR
jgi:hypothetical protein